VSDGATPRIDPRFDPRFQRGYVPDAAPPASAPEPVPPPAPQVPPARVTEGEADDTGASLLELLAQTEPRRLARADRESAADQPADGVPAHSDPAHVERVADAAPTDPEGQDQRRARWFWIALAACVLFVVVGIALFWNGASDRSMFRAAPASLEGAFNQFSMTLAPGLVQAGVLGAVAVLVVWAITGRRSRRGAE